MTDYPISVYITTATLGYGTGGGSVSYNEALALNTHTEMQLVLCAEEGPALEGLFGKPSPSTDLVPVESINPAKYWPGGFPPFMWDYFACRKIRELPHIVHIRGDPFGGVVRLIRAWERYEVSEESRYPCQIIVSCPAHDLEESIREFERFGQKYPWNHMTDPFLWEMHTEHIVKANVVICPSNYSRNYLIKKLHLQEKQVIVIPHGHNPPADIVAMPQQFTVGCLGQSGPDKGHIYLVQAWNKLKQDGFDGKILLAGDATEGWGGMGRVKHPSEIYNGCTVYVQPSVTEGFGLPVLEAMGYARPVIVTSTTGASELVVDGVNGFVVPPRSPEAIAEKIKYLHDNPNEVYKMSAAARDRSMDYTWEKMREKYAEVYRK